MSKIIIRNISTFTRMKEIIDSMRNPIIEMERTNDGVPTIKVKAIAENGICEYRFKHSGLLGMEEIDLWYQDLRKILGYKGFSNV